MRPGSRSAVLALALALLAWCGAALGQISPGPLSRAHRALEGVDQCVRCHDQGDRIAEGRCLQCHQSLAARVSAGQGYHARVRGRACEDCHAEHRGLTAPQVSWPGGARDRFDHARLAGWGLDGAHARLRCAQCHQPRYQRDPILSRMPVAERPRSFLGLQRACASCHDDPHRPSLGADCRTCHTTTDWAGASQAFDHARARFPLRGAHATVTCVQCHAGATPGHPASYRGVAFARCDDCHRDPHADRMDSAGPCTACHNETAWGRLVWDRARHAPQTFALTGGHQSVNCARCHGAALDRETSTACASCHRDRHTPSLGSDCARCHSVSSWLRARGEARDRDFHDRSGFPLRGAHQQVACERCHSPRVSSSRRFRGIAHARCEDCHRDAHAGQLRDRPDQGRCEACHDESTWHRARFEAEDHARTRFALDGAHRAVACASCHATATADPGFDRGSPPCSGCHQDVHRGQFVREGRPVSACASCHAPAAWRPSTFDVAAHARTGFALTGQHDAPCARCHAPERAGAPTRFAGTPRDCSSCHADSHRGQFAPRPCASCHQGSSFTPASGFDHASARFALDGRHASLACNRCHQPTPGPTGDPVVVYRLDTPPACGRCHADPHGARTATEGSSARRLADATRGCEGCHGTGAWSMRRDASAQGFDHTITGAPLTGAHDRVSCAGCHQGRDALGPMNRCGQCHTDRHRGQLGEDCARCHSPRTWTPDTLLVDHQRTRFPLLGAHAVQDCARCHTRATQGDFRDAVAQCDRCHQETLAQRRPHPPHTGPLRAGCDQCHTPLAWSPAFFDHGTWWPLLGRHAAVSCQGCHTEGRYPNTPTACVGCHDGDQRRSRVDHSGFPNLRSCDACHDPSGWLPARLQHDMFFPLRGDHSGLSCNNCHTDTTNIRVFTCTDCHAHGRAGTDDDHRGVRNYAYESRACRMCHANGRAD